MKKLSILSLLAVLAFALVAVGCGSDDSSTDSSTSAELTKAEFVAQGNAICAAGNKTIDAATGNFTQNTPQAQITAAVNDTLIPAVQTEIEGLEALTPPAADQDQVDAILAAANEGLDKLKSDPTSVTSGDPFADANKLANEYGLTECGS